MVMKVIICFGHMFAQIHHVNANVLHNVYVYCSWWCWRCNEVWLSCWQCLKRGSNNLGRMHMSQSMSSSALLLWSVVSLWVSVSEECILWFIKMTFRTKCLVKGWWRQSSSSCRVLTFTVSLKGWVCLSVKSDGPISCLDACALWGLQML